MNDYAIILQPSFLHPDRAGELSDAIEPPSPAMDEARGLPRRIRDSPAMRKLIAILPVIILASSLAYGAEKRFLVPIGDSPTAGPADAPVTMVEFLDFQ